MLSHSAIIAREYGIPCVVATGNATEVLTDGQWVTVDGSNGVVAAALPVPHPTPNPNSVETRSLADELGGGS